MSKNLFTFSSLLLILTVTTLLFFRKYLALGINHTIFYCQTLLGTSLPSVPKEVNFMLAVSGLLLLAMVLVKMIYTLLHIKVVQEKVKLEINLPKRLQILISNLNLAGKVKLVSSQTPFAFCFGLACPKIYLSSTLVKTMSPLELKAILIHERYHLEKHDSLALFIGKVSESLFPFFPVISDLVKNFRIKREINADNEAVRILGNRDVITSAIKKLLSFEIPAVSQYPAFAQTDTLEERILALMGKKRTQRLNLLNLVLSVTVFLAVVGVTTTPISAFEIHHDHTDAVVVCLNPYSRNFSTPSSQIPR